MEKYHYHYKWISCHHNNNHHHQQCKCLGKLVCHMRFYVIYAILIVLFIQVQYGTISCHSKYVIQKIHSTHTDRT